MAITAFPPAAGGGSSNAFITGTGAPSSGTGNNGDAYLDTAASALYIKAAGAWGTATSLIGGANASPVSGVVATLSATWSASGAAVSWTVPTTVNGQTVTKLVVIDVVTRLVSGSPGTTATYGISISGNVPYSSRPLPPQGSTGVDVGMTSLNTQNLSTTYKMAGPGDTITATSGGTFGASATFAIDIFGYYVGLSPGTGVTASSNAAASTTVVRDSAMAARFAPPQIGVTGATTPITLSTADSNAVYTYTGTTTDQTLNLPAVGTGLSANFRVIHRGSGAGGRVLIYPPSGGLIYTNGTLTAGSSYVCTGTPGGYVELIGLAGTNNYFAVVMTGGGWNDGTSVLTQGQPTRLFLTKSTDYNMTGLEGDCSILATGAGQTITLAASPLRGQNIKIFRENATGNLSVSYNGAPIKFQNGTTLNSASSYIQTSNPYSSLEMVKCVTYWNCLSVVGSWTFT